MTDLSELIERVRAATGPDRELDEALRVHFGYPPKPWNYTASIDATLALVELVLRPEHPGMTMELRFIWNGRDDRGWCRAEITWPSHEFIGHAYSAPLAMVEALLLALEAQNGK